VLGLRLRQSSRQAASRAPEQVHQAQVQRLHRERVLRGDRQGTDFEGGRGRVPRSLHRRQDHEGPEQQGREGRRQDIPTNEGQGQGRRRPHRKHPVKAEVAELGSSIRSQR